MTIEQLPWLATFYTEPRGTLFTKTGLRLAAKIGVLDKNNQWYWFEPGTNILLNHEAWNQCPIHGFWDMRTDGLVCPDCKTGATIQPGRGRCYPPNNIFSKPKNKNV